MNSPEQDAYLDAFERAWNRGEAEAYESVTAPTYRRLSNSGQDLCLNDLQNAIRAARAAFPDMTTTIDDVFGNDERIVVAWTSSGTHLGSYLGVPATGRTVSVVGITIAVFADGLVVQERVTWNPSDLLRALGVSSLPEIAGREGPHEAVAIPTEVVRQVHRKFVTGVTVVTTTDRSEPRGLVINAFASVSLNPPLIVVCVARTSTTHPALMGADYFAVNILSVSQVAAAERFARSGGDKFSSIDWEPGATGAPILRGSAAYFEARIHERVQASTHTMFIGHVVGAVSTHREPLVFLAGHMFDPTGLTAAT